MRKSRFNKISRLGLIFPLLLSAAFGTSCAKIGEPQPPEIQIPKPATDLTARQVSDTIVLAFSMPAQNTDGSEARTLASVDVFRLLEDRDQALRQDSLAEDHFVRRAVRVRSIGATAFAAFLQGDFFVIADRPELADKSSIDTHAFRYAVLIINKKNQTAGFSNQAFILPVAMPPAPSGLSAKVAESSIKLSWTAPMENMDGSKPPRIAGYDVFRSSDPQKQPSQPLNSSPLPAPEFEDRDFQSGQVYYYAVRTIGSTQNPYAVSFLSDALKVEARDAFPPAPPENAHAIREGRDIVLLWAPSPSQDVAGYRIYRQERGKGAPILLQEELATTLSFRDSRVESGKQYEYSIQAVDAHGNESTLARTEADIR